MDMTDVARRLKQTTHKMVRLARFGEFDAYRVFKVGNTYMISEVDFDTYLRDKMKTKEVDQTAGILEPVAQ